MKKVRTIFDKIWYIVDGFWTSISLLPLLLGGDWAIINLPIFCIYGALWQYEMRLCHWARLRIGQNIIDTYAGKQLS
jgi:hypothetical protein